MTRVTYIGLLFGLFCGAVARPAFALSPVRQLLLENRLEDALPLCRQFEVLSTNDTDNFLACAWVYLRTERVDSAEKILETYKKSFSSPEYQLILAYAKFKRKYYDEAKSQLSAILSERRGTPYALTAQEINAEIYESQGNLDTAAFLYKQIVGDDPTRGRAHWGLGRYYLARGDTRRALSHLETTTKLWPKHKGSRFNLGVFYLSQDLIPDAAKWLAECYLLDKGDPEVLEQLGIIFEKKNKLPEAIKHWQRALDLKKDSVIAKEKLNTYVVQVIDTYLESRQYEKALIQIESAAKTGADPAKLGLKRALALRNLGKYERALGDFLSYLQTHPGEPLVLRELGICYVNLKLMDQAGSYFSKALAAEPENGINYAWMAYMLEGKGELQKARESWQKAVELIKDPTELEKATRKLSSIERRLGKKEKASGKDGMD